ncbi:MAG: ABC transporter permease [Dehalococcoidia bacterium]|nr:MAG: ABC transporter permease [Dehalococcoidia bacterium]
MPLKGFAGFATRKALAAVTTIFAIICLNFLIFRLLPGDPIRMMFRDPRVSAEQLQLMTEKFGLDKPLWGQFLAYLQALFQGDLGISFWQKRAVLEVIADRIPQTLLLVVTALTIAIILGILLGAISGWKSGTRLDTFILTASLSMYSIPAFSLGIILMLIFAFYLSIFPLGGISTPASGFTGLGYWRDVLWHMFLPTISIVFWYIGEYVLLTRSSMLDTLDQDYITTARAKGLKEFAILRNHALRNALLPVVTATGINLAFAVAGIIEVETVFSWPGIGRLVYDAVMKRDYPLLQGTFLVFAVAVVLANLVVDLIYGFIDPRIKVGKAE